jgi:hypothetical protein
MPHHSRDLVDFAPLLAIAVAVGVALMQYYVQRQQQKQALFEKRFKIYLDVRRFLSIVLKNIGKPIDDDAYQRFCEEMRPARFLFGSDVLTYLNQVHSDISHVDSEHGTIKRVGWEDDDEFKVQLRWGRDAERVFRPYLYIHHDETWLVRLGRRINRWVEEDQPAALASRYDA